MERGHVLGSHLPPVLWFTTASKGPTHQHCALPDTSRASLAPGRGIPCTCRGSDLAETARACEGASCTGPEASSGTTGRHHAFKISRGPTQPRVPLRPVLGSGCASKGRQEQRGGGCLPTSSHSAREKSERGRRPHMHACTHAQAHSQGCIAVMFQCPWGPLFPDLSQSAHTARRPTLESGEGVTPFKATWGHPVSHTFLPSALRSDSPGAAGTCTKTAET